MTNQSKFDFETPPPVSVIFEGERSSTTSGVWSYNQTDELMSFGQSANAGKGVQRRQAPKRVQTCGDLKMGKQMKTGGGFLHVEVNVHSVACITSECIELPGAVRRKLRDVQYVAGADRSYSTSGCQESWQGGAPHRVHRTPHAGAL
eukprot:3775081-Prymnesium_polylepis.1